MTEHTRSERGSDRHITALTVEAELYSTFLKPSQLDRFQSTRWRGVTSCQVFLPSPSSNGNWLKVAISFGLALIHFKGVENLLSVRHAGRRFPTTAAVGRNWDSCRLWHEEQKTGSVKRKEALYAREGRCAHTKPPHGSQTHFLLLPPPLNPKGVRQFILKKHAYK